MLQMKSVNVNLGVYPVIRNLDLEIHPGQIMGLIGPNGAGKTTLIRTISGVQPLSSGRVIVNGQDIVAMDSTDRARLVSVVPQAVNLPPSFTGWETVLLGRTPYLGWLGKLSANDEIAARRAMERTNTLPFAERRVGEISGGEAQRLLLARALAQETSVLLMDEPTAHLDLQYQVSLLDQIQTLARQDGLSILLALHDLNLVARYADRVALLVAGELRSVGTPEEVLTAELLSAAFNLRLEIHPDGREGRYFIHPAETQK